MPQEARNPSKAATENFLFRIAKNHVKHHRRELLVELLEVTREINRRLPLRHTIYFTPELVRLAARGIYGSLNFGDYCFLVFHRPWVPLYLPSFTTFIQSHFYSFPFQISIRVGASKPGAAGHGTR